VFVLIEDGDRLYRVVHDPESGLSRAVAESVQLL
jgi:hypothetical protein